MKRKAKNNNLQKYHQQVVERNTALIKRAIAHIRELDGEITKSVVSKVTYEIADADKGEKGITPAGITKNKLYSALVEEAAADTGKRGRVPRSIRQFSDGDIRMMLHALRVENANLKRENIILSHHLKEIPNAVETTEPVPEKLFQEYNTVKNAARSMVSRLCEMEMAYIDMQNKCLKVAHYNHVIVPKEALELFYAKELYDIQREIRESTPDD